MTDRTTDLLNSVAAFLRNLPAEKIDALVAGEARLEIVPKGARVTLPAGVTKSATLKVSPEQVNTDLKAIGDRSAARRYLEDLGLRKPAIIELAKQLNVAFKSNDTAGKILGLIVDQKVGHRLESDAIFARRQ